MKTKILIYLALVVSLFYIGCQKELADELPPTIPGVIEDSSILLKRYVELDTTQVAPLDTIVSIKFNYDNLKRLAGTSVKEYDNPYSNKTVIFYNGIDTLPYKSILYDNRYGVPGLIDTSTTYYFYNNQAKLIKDSLVYSYQASLYYENVYVTKTYNYLPNSIQYVYKRLETNFNEYTDTAFIKQTFTNNNLVARYDSINYNTSYKYSYDYDNKINPFYILRLPYPYLGSEGNIFENFGLHNITTYKQTDVLNGAASNYHYEFVYKYNELNYPVSATIDDLLQPNMYVNKVLYFY